jgi:hypothetical protein
LFCGEGGQRVREDGEKDLKDVGADDVFAREEPVGDLVLVQHRVELRAAEREAE